MSRFNTRNSDGASGLDELAHAARRRNGFDPTRAREN